MVLKKSKSGANTGNTLRKAIHYGNPGYILKTEAPHRINILSDDADRERWTDDRNIPAGEVSLSLNKRKLWDLPQQLERQIADRAPPSDDKNAIRKKKKRRDKPIDAIEEENDLPTRKQRKQRKHAEIEQTPARTVLSVAPGDWVATTVGQRSKIGRSYPEYMGLNVNLDSHAPVNSCMNSRQRRSVRTPVDVTYEVRLSAPADVWPYRQANFGYENDAKSRRRGKDYHRVRYRDVKDALDEDKVAWDEEYVHWEDENMMTTDEDALSMPSKTLSLESLLQVQK